MKPFFSLVEKPWRTALRDTSLNIIIIDDDGTVQSHAAPSAKMNYDRKEVTIYSFQFSLHSSAGISWKGQKNSHVIFWKESLLCISHGFNQHIISSESWDGKKKISRKRSFLGGLFQVSWNVTETWPWGHFWVISTAASILLLELMTASFSVGDNFWLLLLWSFFILALLFWNQILIWDSCNCNDWAKFCLRASVR